MKPIEKEKERKPIEIRRSWLFLKFTKRTGGLIFRLHDRLFQTENLFGVTNYKRLLSWFFFFSSETA